MKQTKAEAGIGTLILFIALILVAAVAAGVLIQTSNSLQGKALATGSQAKSQVTTNAQFLTIYGEDASGDNELESFFLESKLVAGSDVINLNDAIMEITLDNASSSLNFSGSGNCDSVPAGQFKVEYLINGSNHIDGYLASGDVATLCLPSPRGVVESEKVTFRLIPESGGITTTGITTPSVMNEKTIYLYP